jgi:hypothetical protein
VADSYFVNHQSPGVQVLGPTQVIDVQIISFRTKPSGIDLEYPVPKSLWNPDEVNFVIDAIAKGVEQQIAEGLAVSGSYVQDFDASNLLVDYCDFLVQYDPGDGRIPSTTSVLVPLGAFVASEGDVWFVRLAGSPQSLLLAAQDELRATTNL